MVIKKKLLSVFFVLLINGLLFIQITVGASSPLVENPTVIRVPQDIGNIQTAINSVVDTGEIVIAAGTYLSPDGGFRVNDLQKRFTIRAADGAKVILDGQSQRPILQIVNTTLDSGRPVVLKDLVFANGYSSSDGLAGGVTVVRGEATFINITFQNNSGNQPNSGGGGTVVGFNSTTFFSNCTWENNSAKNEGAGLLASEGSRVYIHASKFLSNRVNLPGHRPTAAGGGIHLGNSILRISNSYFDNNQAGYVGGGLFVIGTWQEPYDAPRADVIVSNSTFVNNLAQQDPGISFHSPTEAGAIHAEDQAHLRVYQSRFFNNRAEIGGGVNLYRARVEIYESVFEGNKAFGSGPANGFGGAISAISNDGTGENVNYPTARLTIENTFIQGRTHSVSTTGQVAGGIYASGDSNRTFGLNGVAKLGSADENRAVVRLRNIIFHDLDVAGVSNNSGFGHGGAVLIDHTDLNADNLLIINSDAIDASNSSGGGVAVLRDSRAIFNDTAWMYNSTERFGGAFFTQGSHIELSNCILAENSNPTQYGSAIFASQMDPGGGMPGLNATGVVHNCTFSRNGDLPHIFDDDRTNGPINDVRYNSNRFFQSEGVDRSVYSNALVTYQNVSKLNNLIINRDNAPSTEKSQVDNLALSSAPKLGKLIVAPSKILPINSVENPNSPGSSYVGYAWSGSSAVLNNTPVSGGTGIAVASEQAAYTLDVGGTRFSGTASLGVAPGMFFRATTHNGSTQLVWNNESGDLLDVAVDQGVSIPSQPSGTQQVALPDQNYSMYAIYKEGGVFITVNSSAPTLSAPDTIQVLVGKNQSVWYGYVPIKNVGGGIMSWNASTTASNIRLDTSSGETTSSTSLVFRIERDNLSLGKHYVDILVDAGEAGSQVIRVEIFVVEVVHSTSMPFLFRTR